MKQYVVTITGTCTFTPRRNTWDANDIIHDFLWVRFSILREESTIVSACFTEDGWCITFIDHLPLWKEQWYKENLLGHGAKRAEIEIREV